VIPPATPVAAVSPVSTGDPLDEISADDESFRPARTPDRKS